jgi:hypothetical protein
MIGDALDESIDNKQVLRIDKACTTSIDGSQSIVAHTSALASRRNGESSSLLVEGPRLGAAGLPGETGGESSLSGEEDASRRAPPDAAAAVLVLNELGIGELARLGAWRRINDPCDVEGLNMSLGLGANAVSSLDWPPSGVASRVGVAEGDDDDEACEGGVCCLSDKSMYRRGRCGGGARPASITPLPLPLGLLPIAIAPPPAAAASPGGAGGAVAGGGRLWCGWRPRARPRPGTRGPPSGVPARGGR